MSELVFKPLAAEQLPAIARIEQLAHAFPWSHSSLQGSFGRLYHNTGLWRGLQLLGYSIVREVAGEAELLNLAVDPGVQGLGLGKQLMKQLIADAEAQHWQLMCLEVRESNLRAINLYNQFEFVEVERRKAYYPSEQGREDAIVMFRHFPAE
ncbi:ribosomal protein S18-alanine N-acetyltransferase [Aliagarivorans taiwanensis]|uniref:ribosomal protein S18-alanine N-acetyltransferase n=1 Tax=Aliagarivorans taiwanensis TaxID=561966 RepID=UPI0004104E33|nr:ribosomal protein S18-alanine N-acetyltransferase [Aliagarivorans taiwanensis]